MTLALLVAVTTLLIWPVLLFLRWAHVLPVTRETSGRGVFVALTFSGASVGGVYPVVWAISSNLRAWGESGRVTFTFAGHLPPGVDEDDLLVFIVVGMLILLIQATAQVRQYVVDRAAGADSG